jgi:hypothetical protein
MCHAYFPYALIELVYMAVAISQQEDFAPVSASPVYLRGIVEHSFKGGSMLGARSAKQSASLHHCRGILCIGKPGLADTSILSATLAGYLLKPRCTEVPGKHMKRGCRANSFKLFRVSY